jgi:hypothetical protein
LVEVHLLGDDLLPEDDFAAYVVRPSRAIRAAMIGPENLFIRRALDAVPGLLVTSIKSPDEVAAFNFDLAVYYQSIPETFPTGVVVLIDPPEQTGQLAITSAKSVSGTITADPDPILDGIDFSGLRVTTLKPVIANWLFPIAWVGKSPMIYAGQRGLTSVFIWSGDLSDGNITGHPAFPLLIANAAEHAVHGNAQTSYPVGVQYELPDSSVVRSITITDPLGIETTFDAQRNETSLRLSEPGLYHALFEDLEGTQTERLIPVYAGDPREVRIAPRPWVGDLLTATSTDFTREAGLLDLTPWLIGLALGMLFLEARRAWR